MRQVLRRIGWTLIWGALLIFAFLGYQLFITDILNGRLQAEAEADLAADLAERRVDLPEPEVVTVDVTVPDTTDTTAPGTPTTTLPRVDYIREEAGEEGSTLGRLVIPSLEVDEVTFEGVSRETLKMGPGHMPGTPVPGQPGNAVLSGHRTTYGRPFYDLDQLEAGDRIEVETATGLHVYEVRRSVIVEPDDVWVIEPIAGAWLTLTTCHPQFSAAERLIIQAELVEGPNLEYANLLARTAEGREEAT
ncbi:MAG: sortase [Acidimicrobiia bacterium]